jgi:hypothetical protein
VTDPSKKPLLRLKTVVSLHEENKAVLAPLPRWNARSEPAQCRIVAEVPAQTGTALYAALAGVSRIKKGGVSNLMEMPADKLAEFTWLRRRGDRFATSHVLVTKSNSIALASAIGHWRISLLWRSGGSNLLVREDCPHSFNHPCAVLV